MNNTVTTEIDKRLHILGESLKGKLPPKDLQNYKELINAGEEGIALEFLTTQIAEYDVILEKTMFKEIKALCLKLHIDKNYFEQLKNFTVVQK